MLAALAPGGPGAFHLAMTGEEHELAERVLDMGRRFFDLPTEIKRALDNDMHQFMRVNGFCVPSSGPGYRGKSLDANFSKDHRESYNMGRSVSGLDPMKAPYGDTRWPSPADLPSFRMIMEEYAEVLRNRSTEMKRALAEALNCPGQGFDDAANFCIEPWLLGLVRYQPAAEAKQGPGIAPHQDSGLFTLLYTDGAPGLQLCPSWSGSSMHRDASMHDPSIDWVNVTPRPGHWIVNAGTLLQRWTDGRCHAALHRVVLPFGSGARYSVPFFCEANLDARIVPVGSCATSLPGDCDAPTPGGILLEMARREGLQLIRMQDEAARL